MGLTLDESIEGLSKLESQGHNVFIAPELVEYLGPDAQILVDYVTREWGDSGITIRLADQRDCGCSH